MSQCMCKAYDPLDGTVGWRPCPPLLCERQHDHEDSALQNYSQRSSVKFAFLWYDIWIGAYYSKENKTLYICPLPMCVIAIHLKRWK
jgi:hypothetical protein